MKDLIERLTLNKSNPEVNGKFQKDNSHHVPCLVLPFISDSVEPRNQSPPTQDIPSSNLQPNI
jgi:hypothetical protein